MAPLHIAKALVPLLLAFPLSSAAENQEYVGHSIKQEGDPMSVIYRTANTDTAPGFVLPDDPDVYLNATAHVGTIRVDVQNITAKVDLEAKVLGLLHLTAGVDASIDRVDLEINEVYAQVELEARLGNVVRMVDEVLGSIELNPIVASLGKNVQKVVDTVADVVGGGLGGNTAGEGSGPTVAGSQGTGGAEPPPGSGHGQQSAQSSPQGGAAQQGQETYAALPNTAGPGKQWYMPIAFNGQPASAGEPPSTPVFKREPKMLWLDHNTATKIDTYLVLGADGRIFKVTANASGTETSRGVVAAYNDMDYIDAGPSVMGNNGRMETPHHYRYRFCHAVRVCTVYKDSAGEVTRTEVVPWDGKHVKYDVKHERRPWPWSEL